MGIEPVSNINLLKMREFRLKKWYPTLPKGWKEREIFVVEGNSGYRLHPALNGVAPLGIISNTEVEEGEYWEEIKPKEELLFTTEDGVEVYEGDKFYVVSKNFLLQARYEGTRDGKELNYDYFTGECLGNIKQGCKYFSTIDLANAYVDLHKPQYNLDTMIRVVNHWTMVPIEKELVKKVLDKLTQG